MARRISWLPKLVKVQPICVWKEGKRERARQIVLRSKIDLSAVIDIALRLRNKPRVFWIIKRKLLLWRYSPDFPVILIRPSGFYVTQRSIERWGLQKVRQQAYIIANIIAFPSGEVRDLPPAVEAERINVIPTRR